MHALDRIAMTARARARRFEGSRFVRFHPWIGEQFLGSIFHCRVLVLGLSHYGSVDEDYREFTIDVVAKVASGQQRIRFFSAVAGSFFNRTTATAENVLFWSNVAFYNFSQELMADVYDRSSRELDEASAPALIEVLGALDPDLVIVCGKHLRQRLLGLGMLVPHEDLDAFRIAEELIVAVAINHPSRGFVKERWHDPIRKGLTLAGGCVPEAIRLAD